jgi:hypothetical protein
MPTEEILKTYSVVELKREIGKARLKNYSKLKKAEVVALMMKNKERFHHLKGKSKAPKAKPAPKPKAKPAPKPKAKPAPKPKAKPAKKEPAFLPDDVMANIKGFMNVGKDAIKRGPDTDNITDLLENRFVEMGWSPSSITDFLDKRKPETEKAKEQQRERARKKRRKAYKKVMEWTIKKFEEEGKKRITDTQVSDYWLYYQNRLYDYLNRTPAELRKSRLPGDTGTNHNWE